MENRVVKIRVPATTANIGPGFDILGLALNLYNNFTFKTKENGLEIKGCEKEFQNRDNLGIIAFNKTLDLFNKKHKGVCLEIDGNIPMVGGLGSSATLIVGGIMGANEIYNLKLSKEEILKISYDIEGHGDNVAAAIYGGLILTIMEEVPVAVSYDIHSSWKFYALLPNYRVSTIDGRNVLPRDTSYENAVYNMGRVPLLLKALKDGDEELLIMVNDKLHEPYRKKLIKEYDKVNMIVKDNRLGYFFISGSGSTCFLISKDNIEKDLESIFINNNINWKILPLSIDKNGASVEVIKSGKRVSHCT